MAAETVVDVWDRQAQRLLAVATIESAAYDVDWSMEEGIVFLALCDSGTGASVPSVEAFLVSTREGN
jgi:hypothetical protein